MHKKIDFLVPPLSLGRWRPEKGPCSDTVTVQILYLRDELCGKEVVFPISWSDTEVVSFLPRINSPLFLCDCVIRKMDIPSCIPPLPLILCFDFFSILFPFLFKFTIFTELHESFQSLQVNRLNHQSGRVEKKYTHLNHFCGHMSLFT